MSQITVEAEIDVWSLPFELKLELSHRELIQFIMEIDEHVADYDFTKALAEKVNHLVARFEGDYE